MLKRIDLTDEEYEKFFKINPNPNKSKLGDGGYGIVFRALDTRSNEEVAIKISKKGYGDEGYDEDVSLLKEGELALQLPAHRNIASFLSYGRIGGKTDYIVSKFYEDGNLLKLMGKNAPHLSEEQKVFILEELLTGIKFLHDNNKLHRDLKPGNILIEKEGNNYVPKITDFGISRFLDSDISKYSNDMIGAGTEYYASPEQIKDDKIRKNSDLWNFGVIAFQLFTGVSPFDKNKKFLEQLKKFTVPNSIKNIPKPWQAVIKACLKANPDERVKSCDQCFEILGSNEIEEDDTKPAHKKRNRKKVRWILIVCVIAGVGLILSLIFLNIQPINKQNTKISHPKSQNIPIVSQDSQTHDEGTQEEENPSPGFKRVIKSMD